MKHLLPLLLLLLFCLLLLLPAQTDSVYQPTSDELTQIRSKLTQLGTALEAVRGKVPDELFADAEIYHKAGVWILRYPEEFYTAAYVKQTLTVLDRGLARAKELQAKGAAAEWTTRTGRLARAYRSQVDDSVQPYGLIIPAGYRADQPARLDVVLHGRAATMNEVSFLFSHDSDKPAPPEQNQLVLEVFGRTNNAYRWAGETDVYEALASVQQRYKIDPNRIVLRGFSMGGAGAWHIGLHDPSRWAAMEAGAGFTETKTYAKQTNLPPAVEATLHIYDSEDYAHNAWNVPTVGYGGEIDPQRRASVSIREALTREGVRFTPDGLDYTTKDLAAIFLTGPQTAHKFHPDSKAVSDAFIDKAVAAAPRNRDHLRFVTYTPRYGRDFWAQVNALTAPYQRAELDAVRDATGKTITIKTSNIARLLLPDPAQGLALTIDGQTFQFQAHQHVTAAELVVERHAGGKWTARDEALLAVARDATKQKRTGLQGPIDDAFMAPFLCVRPTGKAWNSAADQQARQRLERFTAEFAKYMRGDVRVKDDRDVTADDLARYHVIVFGDPGSNSLLAKMLPKLPLTWTREQIRLGSKQSSYAAAEYLPALIYPNPLEPRRYVVVNSGHTFGARDFIGTNALLFPRLGDWAVFPVQEGKPAAAIGLFDSGWNVMAAP